MIYCCHIQYNAKLLKKAELLCPAWRREKAERLDNQKVRAKSVAAGLLLRYCLGSSAEEITFSEKGKPILTDGRYLSLSHSGDYAACAVSDSPIGVDIQKIVDISPRTIARFCTEFEWEYLNCCKNPKADAIKLWALKESWLKATNSDTASAFRAQFNILANNKISGPEGFCYEIYEDISGYIVAACEKIGVKNL